MHEKMNEKIENMYFMALENSYDEIFITDKDGVTLYCNPAFEEQYGYKVEDVLGTSNFFEDNSIFDFSPEQTTIKSGEATTIEKVTISGKKLWITTKPVFDEDGVLKYIVGNSRDISKIEEMKDEIKHYKNQLDFYQSEIEILKSESLSGATFNNLENRSFKEIIKKIHKVASKDASVLILGESGTGKSHFAKFIHDKSHRKEESFVTVDCGSLHASLIESELFGYVDGAFTGARKGGKPGLIEAADGGTLFLDEIGEMPMSVQVKLLGLIQEKKYMAVGGDKTRIANVRILVATNQNLTQMVEKKEFRSDLYYRLKIVEFELPALRERSEDILGLSNYFLSKLNNQYNSSNYFNRECIKKMINYVWNGNIRELRNVIEQMIIFAEDDEIKLSDLPDRILTYTKDAEYSLEKSCGELDYTHDKQRDYKLQNLDVTSLKERLESLEKEIILDSYKTFKTSTALAKHLGMSQSQAYRKIEKYINAVE